MFVGNFDVVPGSAEDVAAVGEVMFVGGEDFESDGIIVASGLEKFQVLQNIDVPGAERKVQVSVSPFVIVQVNVLEPFSIVLQDFFIGVFQYTQIAMAYVEMKGEVGQRLE